MTGERHRAPDMIAHCDQRLMEVVKMQTRLDAARKRAGTNQLKQLKLDRVQNVIDHQRRTWRHLKEQLARIESE